MRKWVKSKKITLLMILLCKKRKKYLRCCGIITISYFSKFHWLLCLWSRVNVSKTSINELSMVHVFDLITSTLKLVNLGHRKNSFKFKAHSFLLSWGINKRYNNALIVPSMPNVLKFNAIKSLQQVKGNNKNFW